MPNYSQIQFIAWGLYTGPVFDDSRREGIGYSGLSVLPGDLRLDVLGQFIDIKARVAFTKEAIDAAYQNATDDPDTLKIFVAPEFLYRGAAGAYAYDLLNGWEKKSPFQGVIPPPYNEKWPGLFGELKELVRDPKFRDWIFVFGSAVGAAFQPAKSKTVMTKNDYLASGWNLSLVQCGGDTREQQEACYFTQKHLKSGVDFIEHNLENPRTVLFTNKNIEHTTARNRSILDRLMLEDPLPGESGGSLFCFPHICNADGETLRFGLEICLDHAQKKNPDEAEPDVTGRLALGGGEVDVQLVISCGMMLLKTSMALAPRKSPQTYSYALNCDGLISLDPDGGCGNVLGGHLQLWESERDEQKHPPRRLLDIINTLVNRKAPNKGEEPPDPQGLQSFPVEDKAALPDLQLPANIQRTLEIDLKNINASQLWYSHKPFEIGRNPNNLFWPQGAGFVHIVPALPLHPRRPVEKLYRTVVRDDPDAFEKDGAP